MSKWLIPPLKKINVERLCDISWCKNESQAKKIKIEKMPAFNDTEIDELLTEIKNAGETSAIMLVRPKFMDGNVDDEKSSKEESAVEVDEETPQVLSLYLVQLYNENLVGATLTELQDFAKTISLTYTEEEIRQVERLSRNQNQSKFWFRFRTGRVTASLFKRVCRTTITNPSISLIKQICFPQNCVFETQATKFGNENKKNSKTAICRVYVAARAYEFKSKIVRAAYFK